MRAKCQHEIMPNYLIVSYDRIIGKGCRDDVAVNSNFNSETVLRDLYRLLTRVAACRHTPLMPFNYAAGS
jgi:hypothetical protein